MRRAIYRLLIPALLLSAHASAEDTSAPNNEAVAILEIAGATSTSITGEGSSFGPNIAVEVTPIENRLELELGVTPFFRRHHSAEWNTDLLFKKPWNISKRFEFMIGGGPEWVHSSNRNSLAGEAAIDLMFWPGAKRRFGMFIEPSYDYNFFQGHEQSFGVTAGLLIGIR